MAIRFLDEQPKKRIRFVDEVAQDSFLPGKAAVEARIPEQPDLLSKGIERAKRIPEVKGFLPKAGQVGLAGLETVGGLFQRGEAAIATPALRAQEITGTPGFRGKETKLTGFGGFGPGSAEEKQNLQNRLNFAKELGFDVVRGLKGEKLTEFGDVPRRAGVPEPISAFIGLGATAGLTDVLTGKAITQGLNQMSKGLGKLIKGDIPFKAATDVTLKASDDFISGLRKLKTTFGNAVGQTIREVGGRVNQTKLVQILQTLPDTALTKMKDNIFGLKFLKGTEGVIDDGLENVWKFRKFLDDFLTDKDFIEATSRRKQVIKDARRAVKSLMEEVSPRIKPVMDDYSRYIGKFTRANKLIIDPTSGIVLEKKLRTLFKAGSERGIQKEIIGLIEFMPEAENLLRTIVRFNRGQAVKGVLKGVGRTAATVGILRGAFKGVGQGGGDAGSSSPTPK